ncbi:WecB/TagA/CpsF family glycosyltransferase [Blastopirellula sp. JC732]|uniref:WecB/TagA/CpsF family glycosyltransferase n=1 Tax=Blastopirellula sediminis TaxID=2894196 RepID=A0A9X1MQ50_9BACT|nr:WecB/TagA/CpsF family glycosyltransferase [Blastopirellula sediminis]MCC9605402.1 WecB/TagA/CpsF family glycosyltransferase [Blastopirellula sediminis]MCC9631298.1 WecB/TagA/CpsF family glycosyltransferase [Blastopirellula sediminis]
MSRRVKLFGVEIDALRMPEVVSEIWRQIDSPDSTAQYVVTPNVDHAVLLQEDPGLQSAYAEARWVLADGWPVVWASRFLRQPLPERVAGSDLVPNLFASASEEKKLSVFLLGAAPGVAQRAAAQIEQRWPNVTVCGTYSPPLGFEHDEAENERIIEMINAAAPQLLVIGLGAPKQELWIARHHSKLKIKAAVCAGATIDFLAGEKQRAPRWMQQGGIEWLHRMLVDPRRLVRRYVRDAIVFPTLVWREWLHVGGTQEPQY